MPAKSKSAAKKSAPIAAAKGAKKATSKSAVRPKAVTKPKPKSKPSFKPKAPKPKKSPQKAAAKKKSPPVKKAPTKTSKKPVAAKKAVTPAKKPKPAPAKKAATVAKKAPSKQVAKKPAPAAKTTTKNAPELKVPARGMTPVVVKPSKPARLVKPGNIPKARAGMAADEGITQEAKKKPVLPAAFLKKQRARLVELRDAYLNSAEGVAQESLRQNENGDSSAFGMHQADAGSDAYDRDFALSLLAKEQDAIYEINEALKRIDSGTYGVCEMSGQLIPEERLEALPFTRFTVECQGRIEREQMGGRWNRPVRSLFGLDESAEDADDDRDEEETPASNSEQLDFSKE